MKEIIGDRILLRSYKIEDTESFFRWRNDSQATKFMGRKFRNPSSFETIKTSLSRMINFKTNDSICYVIAQKDTRDYIGSIDITSIDPIDKIGTLTIVIGTEAFRNQGFGTEAIGLLLEYAFTTHGLHKIELGVYENNTAALKCYQKIGFQIEGKLRDHMLIDDTYYNLLQMGILNSEFQSK